MKRTTSNNNKRTNAPRRLIESELTHSRTRRCYRSCYSNRQPNHHNHSNSQTFHHSSPHQLNGEGAGRARMLTHNNYLARPPHQRQTRTSHNRRSQRNRK